MNHNPVDRRVPGELADLANYLDQSHETIMSLWRDAVDQDPRLKTASRLTRKDFEDNISSTLELLSKRLRDGSLFVQEGSAFGLDKQDWADQENTRHAAEHGLHRWQAGYDLRELVIEWGHLHLALVHLLNEYGSAHPGLQRQTTDTAQILVCQLFNGGFSQSTGAYFQLHQAEVKEIIRDLNMALEEVQEWERLRGQALREAVHDLRGNLSPVLAASDLLRDAHIDEAGRERVLGFLHRSTRSHQTMLSNLLDLARLEAGQEVRELRPLNAGALLREMCQIAQPLVEQKGLQLKHDGPATLQVESDVTKLRRIVQNLVLNAIKYTVEGSIDVKWWQPDAIYWCCAITDSGPGLSSGLGEHTVEYLLDDKTPSEPASLFVQSLIENPEDGTSTTNEPASGREKAVAQAQRAAQGEGVGLLIVRRLCTLLDVKMEVETTIGRGTTFTLTLPVKYD